MPPNTETKNQNDDNPESPEISNGISSYESLDAMEENFRKRLRAIADEAQVYGWSSSFSMCVYDPLDVNSPAINIYRGGYYTVLGLLHDMIREIQKQADGN